MTQALQERKRIATNAMQAATRPEGGIARSYSVERIAQDQRLALLLILAQGIPVGRSFANIIDLAMWAFEKLAAHPRGVDAQLRARAMYVVGIMWAALDEAGGAENIDDHGQFLLDVAMRARRDFYRDEATIRQAVAS